MRQALVEEAWGSLPFLRRLRLARMNEEMRESEGLYGQPGAPAKGRERKSSSAGSPDQL